jgi:hypothetical protein
VRKKPALSEVEQASSRRFRESGHPIESNAKTHRTPKALRGKAVKGSANGNAFNALVEARVADNRSPGNNR